MTVKELDHKVHKYIWDTADTPPTAASHGVTVGSTGYDRQTGIMYITYDGTNWVEKDTIVRLETSPTIDIGDVTLLAGTALIGKVGIDQVTANANEVVLKAGSAIVGRTGHDVTGIADNRKAGTAGTAVPLVASSTPCKYVWITGMSTNTGRVMIGGTTVDETPALARGIPVSANQTIGFPIDDLIDVYIDPATGVEGVIFAYLT